MARPPEGRLRVQEYWVWSTVVCALGVACGPELPSSTPLGRGPKAAPLDAGRISVARAESRSKVSTPPSGSTPTTTVPDAGTQNLDAKQVDADAGAHLDASIESSAPPATTLFAGSYAGKDTSLIRLGPMPEQKEEDPNAKLRVSRNGDGSLSVTIVASNTGQDLCTLLADPSGNRATLRPNERCEMPMGPVILISAVDQGRLEVRGKHLELTASFKLEAQLPSETMRGTMEYHFEGKRP